MTPEQIRQYARVMREEGIRQLVVKDHAGAQATIALDSIATDDPTTDTPTLTPTFEEQAKKRKQKAEQTLFHSSG